MKPISSSLDRLRIATPCPADWEQMTGDNRVRFCDLCQLNVYNISELSRTEAETLIASSEGRLCGRVFRRPDGTVITKDCPVGLRALRKRVASRVAAVFAAIVSISTAALGQQSDTPPKSCPTQTKITRVDKANDPDANTVFGTVHDLFGGVVVDAVITINGASLTEPRTVSSNKDGEFHFGPLPAGTYSVEITGVFTPLTLNDVVIETNQAIRIDVVLHFQPLSGVIEIPLSLKSTDSKPNTTVITQDMIKRLPLN